MTFVASTQLKIQGAALECYDTSKQTSEGMSGSFHHDFSTDNLPNWL